MGRVGLPEASPSDPMASHGAPRPLEGFRLFLSWSEDSPSRSEDSPSHSPSRSPSRPDEFRTTLWGREVIFLINPRFHAGSVRVSFGASFLDFLQKRLRNALESSL